MIQQLVGHAQIVHCRTGSLETAATAQQVATQGALPYRQLRKVLGRTARVSQRSLPYRQLRNRQLRNPVRLYSVHCRTGSLEISPTPWVAARKVHCRTGSLENARKRKSLCRVVHCRTGSLEIIRKLHSLWCWVHCRTGSLEIWWPPGGLLLTVHCRTGSLEKNSPGKITKAFTAIQTAQKSTPN